MSIEAKCMPWRQRLDLQPACTGWTIMSLCLELLVADYHTRANGESGVNPLVVGVFTAARLCMP